MVDTMILVVKYHQMRCENHESFAGAVEESGVAPLATPVRAVP